MTNFQKQLKDLLSTLDGLPEGDYKDQQIAQVVRDVLLVLKLELSDNLKVANDIKDKIKGAVENAESTDSIQDDFLEASDRLDKIKIKVKTELDNLESQEHARKGTMTGNTSMPVRTND